MDKGSSCCTRLTLRSGVGSTSKSIRPDNFIFAYATFIEYLLLVTTKGFEALATSRRSADSKITTSSLKMNFDEPKGRMISSLTNFRARRELKSSAGMARASGHLDMRYIQISMY